MEKTKFTVVSLPAESNITEVTISVRSPNKQIDAKNKFHRSFFHPLSLLRAAIFALFQEQDSQRKTKIPHFYLTPHLDGDFAPHTLDSAPKCA